MLGWIESVTASGIVNRTTAYEYEDGSVSGRVIKQTLSPYEMQYKYDGAGRITEVKTFINGTEVNKTTTEYYKVGDHATNMPFCITHTDVDRNYKLYACTYDKRGNITTLENNSQHRYWYDDLNRLVREMWTGIGAPGKDITYKYDKNGNIKSKIETYLSADQSNNVYDYTYFGDRLMSFDGTMCSYDAMGNPTMYRNKTATWGYGRKLLSLDGNTFEYNAKGQRIKKNSIEYYYDSQGRLIKQSNGFEFFYDVTGLVGFMCNGVPYTYRKDLQGNIAAILAPSGTVLIEYDYDAWGNRTMRGANLALGNANPFGYRGYYYDTETKLYYLQTRYYDPETGRFLNMDSIDYADPENLNGLNLYAYCNNNPVMYVDPTGHFVMAIGGTMAALFGLLGISIIEIQFHPIENTINTVSDLIDDLINNTIKHEYTETGNVGYNSVAEKNTLVMSDLADISFSKLIIVESRERNRGHDTGLKGKTNGELEVELNKAKQAGDSLLMMRILKEMKMRGMRNTRKQRGGPHMRGFLLLLLLGDLFYGDKEY